jgi:hypothetical protein
LINGIVLLFVLLVLLLLLLFAGACRPGCSSQVLAAAVRCAK